MVSRTTRTVARFSASFWLAALDEQAPAGEYRVDHEWTLLEGGSQLGLLRNGSFIHLPAVNVTSRIRQLLPISSRELSLASETACSS